MQHINRKDLDDTTKRVLGATFPAYRGRKFKVNRTESLSLFGTMWDGGTKHTYALVRLDPFGVVQIPTAPFLKRSAMHENDLDLPIGYVVVEHRIFCGKDAGITFHVHPSETTMLPAPTDSLTSEEKVVLVATRSFKNTYSGQTNLQFKEANRTCGITEDMWESTKTALIERGLLTKAGAITTDGRNAVSEFGDLYGLSAIRAAARS